MGSAEDSGWSGSLGSLCQAASQQLLGEEPGQGMKRRGSHVGEAELSREWVKGGRGQKSEMRVQEGKYEEVKLWGLQRGIVIWGKETWVSPLPFMIWGALQKGLTLSEPPFCHLENGADDHVHPLSFIRLV